MKHPMSAIFANIRMILGLVRPTSMTWYLDTPSKDPHTPSLVVRISNFCNQHRNLCLTGICTGPWNFWQCPEWPALGGMLYTLETCAALCSLRVTMGRFQYAPLTLLFGAWIPQFRIRRYIIMLKGNFRQVEICFSIVVSCIYSSVLDNI